MKAKTIKQTNTFNVTPERVYDLLMNEELHATFTGSQVRMSTEINGQFIAYGDIAKDII